MSKENKVNPGQYTQAGRLTPDETAREMKKQRELSSPSRTDGKPHPFAANKREQDEAELDDERKVSADETDAETDADNEERKE